MALSAGQKTRALAHVAALRGYDKSNGPGTELMVLFSALTITPKGCSCNAVAAQMNLWGPDGCRLPANRARIIANLKEGQDKYSWWDYAKATFIAANKGWAFALTWDGLVEESCKRAEQKSPNLGERVG